MIKSIHIQGFQSHINSKIEFAPNLTVITSATDSGKTAIIRAIRWLAFGEPGGESFINDAVGQAIVEVTMDDGTVVRKTRKNKRTEYAIIKGQNVRSWESAAVPLEVTETLGITKQTFGDIETALNFAYQLEAPFLISQPASAGAKILGKIAGTEVVDLAVKDVAKDTYAARQDVAQANKTAEKIETDLCQYSDLEILKKQIQACESLIEQCDQKSDLYKTTLRVKKTYENAYALIAERTEYLKNFADLNQAETAIRTAANQSQKAEDFKVLKNRQLQCETVIDKKQRVLLQLDDLDKAGECIGIIEEAILRMDSMTRLAEESKRLSDRIETAKKVIDETCRLDKAIDLVTTIQVQSKNIHDLRTLQVAKLQLDRKIRDQQNIIEVTKGCEKVSDLLCQVEGSQKHLNALQSLQMLSKAKESLSAACVAKDQAAGSSVNVHRQALDELWAGLDVCPLCEQPIVKGEKNHGC